MAAERNPPSLLETGSCSGKGNRGSRAVLRTCSLTSFRAQTPMGVLSEANICNKASWDSFLSYILFLLVVVEVQFKKKKKKHFPWKLFFCYNNLFKTLPYKFTWHFLETFMPRRSSKTRVWSILIAPRM